MNIGEIYKKYKYGDHITNEELKYGIEHFSQLEEYLSSLGERFHHSWRDVFDVKVQLLYFQKSRK